MTQIILETDESGNPTLIQSEEKPGENWIQCTREQAKWLEGLEQQFAQSSIDMARMKTELKTRLGITEEEFQLLSK